MKVGQDIYSLFKRNNLIVKLLTISNILVVLFSFGFCFMIYQNSKQNIYAITQKGILVPLRKLDTKKDRVKQVKANLAYFCSLYYDIDGYTMKDKKEKLFWLLGKQPTEVVKDRDQKGYFNSFLSFNGLVQHSFIDESSWKVSSLDSPYQLYFNVIIIRINGDSRTYYKSEVAVSLQEVNINYPYNPYGLLITQLSENLTDLDPRKYKEIEQNNIKSTSQND